MKSSVYRNATVVACALGLLGLLLAYFQVSVSFESEDPEKPFLPPTQKLRKQTTDSPPVFDNKAEQSSKVLTYSNNNSVPKAGDQGSLRMSNQTDQPVRLAMLARSPVKGEKTQTNSFDVPAHWDFAPREGNEKGLILSLPQGNLKLEKGDILVAFAQDGSRRYWGPYVVGETSIPVWNAQSKEWQLILSQ
ncbi:hypothetical protein NIES4075_14170 [Tolypothrix sp. NIES-4075]|uniref:hypothetical protein n=1 Tax=Tolypothrix sp. NIES-4075 TaxID=2005459 RepID=UPI000B5CB83A|nr:hypothetical protein [Tolypothrix sp. NIES-4075]GAX40451.1 hypothetical protein NIES4075_14170 [Tolypothrix sp. NIES-4075]